MVSGCAISLLLLVCFHALSAAAADQAEAEGVRTPNAAICISGGMRTADLTAASIMRYFVRHVKSLHHNTTLLLATYVDPDAHKITLFDHFRKELKLEIDIGAVYLAVQEGLPTIPFSKFLPKNAPAKNIVGMFKIVEMCNRLLSAAEAKNGITYDVVYRLRPDLLFHSPPLIIPVTSRADNRYFYPREAGWGGFNDRFGYGAARVMRKMMARFTQTRRMMEVTVEECCGNSEQHLKKTAFINGIVGAPFACDPQDRSRDYYSLSPDRRVDIPIVLNGTVPGKRAACPDTFCLLKQGTGGAARYPILDLAAKKPVTGGEKCAPSTTRVAGKWGSAWPCWFKEMVSPWVYSRRKVLVERSREKCMRDMMELYKACVGGTEGSEMGEVGDEEKEEAGEQSRITGEMVSLTNDQQGDEASGVDKSKKEELEELRKRRKAKRGKEKVTPDTWVGDPYREAIAKVCNMQSGIPNIDCMQSDAKKTELLLGQLLSKGK